MPTQQGIIATVATARCVSMSNWRKKGGSWVAPRHKKDLHTAKRKLRKKHPNKSGEKESLANAFVSDQYTKSAQNCNLTTCASRSGGSESSSWSGVGVRSPKARRVGHSIMDVLCWLSPGGTKWYQKNTIARQEVKLFESTSEKIIFRNDIFKQLCLAWRYSWYFQQGGWTLVSL